MNACPDHALDLTLHASGALDAHDAATLERHLGQCAACRGALSEERALLGELAPVPPSPSEDAALARLPERALSAWQRHQTRRFVRGRALGGLAALAAGAVLLVWARPTPTASPPAAPPVSAAAPAVSDDTLEAFRAWSERGPLATELVSTQDYDDPTAVEGDEDALVIPAGDLDLYPEAGASR